MAEPSGELRTVSVLFADMSGSVATFHGTDAESATDRVNQVLEAMVASVTEHGGTVDRFLGDGLLALFGATEAREDDPVRAVRAGLDLCRRVADLGAAATAGVNTGGVYIGEVGSDAHRETTAIGPVVNLAARLQGQATAGQVVVSAPTARLCRDRFDLVPRVFSIKGIPEPVDGFVVTAEIGSATKVLGRGLQARTVGRDDELANLASTVRRLGAGEGSVALLVGEAGLGKSTLAAEALRMMPPDVVVLEGRCSESGAAPFQPFVDALRGHLSWGPSTGPADRRADIERLTALAGTDDSLAAHALANLLGAGSAGIDEWEQLPPPQRQRETFRAVRLLLRGMLHHTPVVFVLEDLHWADPASIALTSELFSVTAEGALALICTIRPVRDHPSWTLSAEADARGPGSIVRIHLSELDDDACASLMTELLGSEQLPQDLRPAILDRAQGNPLFVQEFVRSAVESGWLRQQDGRWLVDRDADLGPVPDTLELIVRARTDRLPGPVRRVLQLAALQGRIFSAAVLALLEGHELVAEALAMLEERGLAEPARDRSDDEWTFSHVLVQETIRQGVLRRARPGLHLRLLDALEVVHADHLEEHAALLAHHAEEAADAERAVRHLRTAALSARSSHVNDTAADLLGRALSWAERAPVDDDAVAELHELRGDVLQVSGRHDDAVTHYGNAATLTHDRLRRARLARKAGGVAVVQRRYDDALRSFDAATRELEGGRRDEASASEWIDIHLARAGLHYWRNEPKAIGEALEAVRHDVDHHGSDAQRADALQAWMMRRLREDRYLVGPEIVDVALRSAELADRRADPGFRAFKRFNLAFCRLWARDVDAALADFALAVDDGERAGDVVVLSRCHTYAAVAHRFALDDEGCEREIEAAEHASRSGEMLEYLAAADANRAWLGRRRGDAAEVRRRAAVAIEAWEQTSLVYGFQWLARLPLLVVAHAEGDDETVRAQLEVVLDPSQQRLPGALEELLLRGEVPAAVQTAVALGYA